MDFTVYRIEQLTPFLEWFEGDLSEQQQDKVTESVSLLSKAGPFLGHPFVDTVKKSKYPNMKELRVDIGRSRLRVFFAFDPKRKAVLLIGGDKQGRKRFYDKMIPKADEIYTEYLADLD